MRGLVRARERARIQALAAEFAQVLVLAITMGTVRIVSAVIVDTSRLLRREKTGAPRRRCERSGRRRNTRHS